MIQVQQQSFIRNQKGFTLIEMISIMIILGVLGSVGVKKYDNFTHTASEQILTTAVYELNTREKLIWVDMKISTDGYKKDEDVYAVLDTNVGSRLKWNPGPNIGGGTFHCESASRILTRTPSSITEAARWQ